MERGDVGEESGVVTLDGDDLVKEEVGGFLFQEFVDVGGGHAVPSQVIETDPLVCSLTRRVWTTD